MTLKNDSWTTFLRKKEEEKLEVYKSVLKELKKDKNKIDDIKIVIAGHQKIVDELKEQELLDAI